MPYRDAASGPNTEVDEGLSASVISSWWSWPGGVAVLLGAAAVIAPVLAIAAFALVFLALCGVALLDDLSEGAVSKNLSSTVVLAAYAAVVVVVVRWTRGSGGRTLPGGDDTPVRHNRAADKAARGLTDCDRQPVRSNRPREGTARPSEVA
jgi:hypothetical protein